ncbi:MAG: type VI secretion system-associated protein TagF [Desulfobacterales bacterium]
MFELINLKQGWKWAVFGKHPVAGDFLTAGEITPLLRSFAKWMEKGHSRLAAKNKDAPVLPWRFWAKGPNKELVCGILHPSQDKHGRKYPILLIGTGKNQDLNKNWNLIPYACGETWSQLEALVQREYQSVRKFRRDLKEVAAPDGNLQELAEKNERSRSVKIGKNGKSMYSDFMNKMNNIEALSRREVFSVHLDAGDQKDTLVPVSKLLSLLKNRSQTAPDVVFWGGREDQKMLFCLKRPLSVDDYGKINISGKI